MQTNVYDICVCIIFSSGTIDEDEARQLIEQSHKDVEDTKARYEAEKYRQEKALQERLNKRKKKELQDTVSGNGGTPLSYIKYCCKIKW